jgi:hypothetical protein
LPGGDVTPRRIYPVFQLKPLPANNPAPTSRLNLTMSPAKPGIEEAVVNFPRLFG